VGGLSSENVVLSIKRSWSGVWNVSFKVNEKKENDDGNNVSLVAGRTMRMP
jgi:hypothetical protein